MCARLASAASRATLGAPTTSLLTSTSLMPPSTSASASATFWQHTPTAPCASCRLAISGHLCVLACGRTRTLRAFTESASVRRLRSKASSSTTSAGVSTSSSACPMAAGAGLVLFIYTVSALEWPSADCRSRDMAKDGKSEITFMRGARSFIQGRFETVARESFDDGWTPEEKDARPLETQVTIERARSIVSHNDSPDVGFDSSINPYRGCEHGCIYCYALPSHSYLELSPGLDFETKLFAKTNAAELLRAEFGRPGYKPSPIALGANTDCYQPMQRKYRITRQT